MKAGNVQDLERNGWKKFRCIEAHQPGGMWYQVAILGKELAERAVVLRRNLDQGGVQRILNKSRCRRIAEFYASPEAMLPGNIIGNVSSDQVNTEEKGFVFFSPELMAEIVDGQHRLFGFATEFNVKDVDFPIFFTFLVDAVTREKANLFYKINKEQKKINPTLAYDLLSVIDDGRFDQEVAELIKRLNADSESPFWGIIKTSQITVPNSTVSLSNMMTVVTDFLKTSTGRAFAYQEQLDSEKLFKLLKNYFGAVKQTLPNEWGNPDSVVSRTLGIGAFATLLNDVLNDFVRKNGGARLPRVDELKTILEPIADFDFDDDDVRGLGGKKGQSVLAERLRYELGLGLVLDEE